MKKYSALLEGGLKGSWLTLLGLSICGVYVTSCRAETVEPVDQAVSNITFVAFDTETTGFSPTKDRIVELGAVKFRDGKMIAKRNWMVNPERKIPYGAYKVHGIGYKDVADKPTYAQSSPEIEEFFDGAIIIAHNARFDVDFVSNEMKRAGRAPLTNSVIDSLKLFRTWYPEIESHSLESVAKHVQVDNGGYHRALADAMYIFLIMQKDMDNKLGKSARQSDLHHDAGRLLHFF